MKKKDKALHLMVVFAYGPAQHKVDRVGNEINEDFKHLWKINMVEVMLVS